MRREHKFWLTSLGVSAVAHLVLLTTAAFAFSGFSRPELQEPVYVEVEFTEIVPVKQIEEQPKPKPVEPVPLERPEPIQPQIQPRPQEPPRPAKSPVRPDNKPLPSVPAPMPQVAAVADSPVVAEPVGSVSPPVETTGGGFKGEASSGSGNNPAGTAGGFAKSQGPGDKRASPSYAPLPDYPTDARTQKLEGTVRVRVEIDKSGRVLNASIAAGSGSPSLDQAALSCARKWRFSPAYRNGSPVADSAVIPIKFDLRRN